MLSARNYIRLLFGVGIAALCIWVAITGRVGSLLGALITPGFMQQGTPPAPGNWTATSLAGASQPPPSGQDSSSLQQRWAYILQIFGNQYGKQALEISSCESTWNPRAYNPTPVQGSHAEGMFQILVPSTWMTTSEGKAGADPYDYQANTRAAYEIFKRDGYSWREWSCASKVGLS